jgi:nucleoside-diphosphate-sugar epimerase
VQIFIENAFAGKDLAVQGDGSEKLDFTYIDDLVNGIERTMLNEKAKGQIFNMTNGAGKSLNDLAVAIQKHFPEIQIEHIERDKMVPVRGTLSIDKARSLLGYEPANPLDIGVPKYIESYRQFLGDAPHSMDE